MLKLFEGSTINNLNLKNRIIRSATWEGMCDEKGKPGKKLIELYKTLAKGGVGLIISGYTYIRKDGKQLPGKMGLYNDEFKNEFKTLTNAVHCENGKIILQLVHAGGQTDSKKIGKDPVAPSSIKLDQFPEKPSQLTLDDIEDITNCFAKAALRAKEWGFDGVQIHGSHGYLVSQFLSPLTNLRDDNYGGNLENRSRFLFEVYSKTREQVGNDFPVFIKFNSSDNVENGFNLDEALLVAKELSNEGIDAIEVSSGTAASGKLGPARSKINSIEKEAYNLADALKIKKVVSCPVIAVGGFRSFEVVNQAVEKHGIDYISISRPLIREPDLPNRWKGVDKNQAKCISCNACFKPGLFKGGIYCVVEKKKLKKISEPYDLNPAPNKTLKKL